MHKLKLFVFSCNLIHSLGDITINLENCLHEVAFRHLFNENDLVVSSNFTVLKEAEDSLTYTEDNTNKNILHLLLNDVFISQHWLLQVFIISNDTISVSVPGRIHEAYIVLSSENKREDIINDLKCQFKVLVKDKAWNPRAKFVILIENKYEENEQESLAQTIFSELWKHFVVNVIVMIQSSEIYDLNFTLNIFTWFPYHPPGRCADIYEPVLLDTCNSEGDNVYFSKNATLFPLKLAKELHGCKLRVSTFELGPMTFDRIVREDGTIQFLEGVEVHLLKVLGKYLNITVFYMPRLDNDLWGVRSKNGSWSGITGEVLKNYSDLAAANMWYKCHIIPNADCLTVHSIDRVTWFVPCAQPYPRWSSLTRVFKASLWLGFLAAYIIVSYIMHLVVVITAKISRKQPENYSFHGKIKVFLNFWAVILEESASNNPPHDFPIRSLFFAWVLYCWAVNNVYQTFLTSFLVDPGLQHQISTEDEMLTSRVLKYGYDINTQEVIPGLSEERYKHRVLCEKFQDCQQKLLKTQNFAFAFGKVVTDYDIAAHYMDGDGKPLICQLEDVVLNQISSLVVQKGYPLLHLFNAIVRRTLESGLVDKWFEDVKYTATLRSARNFNVPTGEYITLSLEHLQSAFYFLIIGCIISLIAFVGELFYHSREKRKLALYSVEEI
ncbi:hypothetical protein L9F63_010921 [Diploptera punctata]|uniref:Uncharacterized protein n=1 Tax=Diploptera punctata TaxID=6984 RepID=A0AAD8AG33_DIPPU|nr:hypothetical protein L9F63_010921 [Diploptera punctata]